MKTQRSKALGFIKGIKFTEKFQTDFDSVVIRRFGNFAEKGFHSTKFEDFYS
jgi:hypothetical protein